MPYRQIPSLNWLRVFEAAARSESFSDAARILNMSPPAVSQQIKALELHLKTPLFDRGPKNVTLTDAGASFLPAVRQSLMSVETTAASLFGHAQGASVTVMATLIFATSWLVPRLAAFEAAHPDIELHIMGDHREVDFSREGPELHIDFGSASRTWGDAELLFGETLYPVAIPDIAVAIAEPQDLLKHRLIEISTHRTSWLQLFASLPDFQMSDARFCFVDSTEIALTMAHAGYGIALARAPATDGRVTGYGLERCLEGVEVSGSEAYHLVSRSFGAQSPAARRFRDWLLDASAQYR